MAVSYVDLTTPMDIMALAGLAGTEESEYVARGLSQIAAALKRFDSNVDPAPFFALSALLLDKGVDMG